MLSQCGRSRLLFERRCALPATRTFSGSLFFAARLPPRCYSSSSRPTAAHRLRSFASFPNLQSRPRLLDCRKELSETSKRFFSSPTAAPTPELQEVELPIDDLYALEKHEPFYCNTTTRYLWNEAHQLEQTHFEYYIPALHDLVAAAHPHTPIRSITKLVDYDTSKLLRFNLSGDPAISPTIFAKVCDKRHVAPAQIHAEVATLSFAARVLGVGAPNVLAYSADSDSAINDRDAAGAPYLVYSIPPGCRLAYEVWPDLSEPQKLRVIDGIVAQQRKMLGVSFTRHGSLYFKRGLAAGGWDADGFGTGGGPVLASFGADVNYDLAEKLFAVGPSADSRFWDGPRKEMDLDRGPWSTPAGQFDALIRNEMSLIRDASPSALPYLGPSSTMSILSTSPSEFRAREFTPDAHLALLLQARAAFPHLVPRSAALTAPRLFHDCRAVHQVYLHADHTFAGFADWAGTHVAPLFVTAGVPGLAANASSCPPDAPWHARSAAPDTAHYVPADAAEAARLWTPPLLTAYYMRMAEHALPDVAAALRLPRLPVRDALVGMSRDTWREDGWLLLLQALVRVQRWWGEVAAAPAACPVEVSAEERAYLRSVAKMRNDLLDMLQAMGVGAVSGAVSPAMFATAGAIVNRLATVVVEEGDDEEEEEEEKDNGNVMVVDQEARRRLVKGWRLTDWMAGEKGTVVGDERGYVRMPSDDDVCMILESGQLKRILDEAVSEREQVRSATGTLDGFKPPKRSG